MRSFNEFLSSNRRVLFLVVVGFGIWVILSFFLLTNYAEKKASYLSVEMDAFKSKVVTTLEMYETFAEYVFTNTINNDVVLDLLQAASTGGTRQKDAARAKLYQLLLEQYRLLQKYDFRQLHFHLSNGDSFLRFHAPERYGDNLMDVRETIRIVNTEKRYVASFEEGRIFNGYRFVYPLVKDDQHIGSVEISISMASLMTVMASLYPTTALNFLIAEDVVTSIVFDEEQDHYMPAPFFPGYMLDEEVFHIFQSNLSDEQYFENCRLVERVIAKDAKKLEQNKSFTAIIRNDDAEYTISFLSIENLARNHVAYIVGITETSKAKIFGFSYLFREWLFFSMFFALFFGSVIVFDRKQKQLNHLANTDKLTGLVNRHKLLEIAEREINHYERYKRDLSVIMLDIDHFKPVNDQYGHATGDDVLKDMARILVHCSRKLDAVARWGGEEFLVLLPETGLANACLVAERIRQNMEAHVFTQGIKLTASLGVASLSEISVLDIDVLVNRADENLYLSKNTGRNRVTPQVKKT